MQSEASSSTDDNANNEFPKSPVASARSKINLLLLGEIPLRCFTMVSIDFDHALN